MTTTEEHLATGAMNRPTLKDVARHAGVSFKTVSRVVNGEPGVSTDMQERVQAAVSSLGYRRNRNARNLRQNGERVGTVGIVHADVTNPFAAGVQASVERHLRDEDVLLLSGSSGEDPDQQERLVEAMVDRRVDGLVVILSGGAPGPTLQRELSRGTPIVFVDRDPGVDADLVMSDHHGGAALATRHLLKSGHRHIGFLGSREETSSVRLRRQGFDQAVSAAGEATQKTILSGLTGAKAAQDAVRALFESDSPAPTALFAAQNLAATGTVRALHHLGLQNTVALVAFDHLEIADVLEPGVTTVPQDVEELGRQAALLLLARLLDPTRAFEQVTVPVALHARGSGELRPAV